MDQLNTKDYEKLQPSLKWRTEQNNEDSFSSI